MAGNPRTRLPATLIGAGLCAAFGSMLMAYVATHPPRRRVRLASEDLPVEDVAVRSRDGLRLGGWFIPSDQARGSVILCHGYPHDRSELIPWAAALHSAHLHLLLFDFRALGESEGGLCSIGHLETADLAGAVDYLCSRAETRELPTGVFGLSMGGAVAIMAAAKDPRIACVATHGAYATLHRAIRQRGRFLLGPLGGLVSLPASWWCRRWIGADPRSVSPLAVVREIYPRPLLIAHGGRDRIVSPADARALYLAAGARAELLQLPRSSHAAVHPEELGGYMERLREFYTMNLAGGGRRSA